MTTIISPPLMKKIAASLLAYDLIQEANEAARSTKSAVPQFGRVFGALRDGLILQGAESKPLVGATEAEVVLNAMKKNGVIPAEVALARVLFASEKLDLTTLAERAVGALIRDYQ